MCDVDVAVVGQGPVGALAALLLGRCGVSVLALDRRAEVYPLPRAVAADEEVQRMLLCAGLGDALRDMLPGVGARFIDRHGASMLDVALPGSGCGLPGLALFRQPDLERHLRGELGRQDSVRVCLGRQGEVVALSQDDSGVDLRLADGSRLRARYLVACDGASSPVRRMVGIPFVGGSFVQRWLVVDALRSVHEDQPSWVDWHCDPAQPAVVVPGRVGTRVELLLSKGHDGGQDVEPAEATRLTAKYLRGQGATVERATTYVFAARAASTWRAGRVLLAGDAAHTMPPFAGQGLAAGVRDVTNLAWKLHLVVSGLASPELLDTYEAERRPHLRQMTYLTRVAGALITPTSDWVAALRDVGLHAVSRLPWVGPQLREGRVKQAQRLPRGAAPPLVDGSHGGGRLAPSPVVDVPGSAPTRLDLLRGTGFALLGVGVHPLSSLDAATKALWDQISTRYIEIPPGSMPEAQAGDLVIVRPDHFVLDSFPAPLLAAATKALFGSGTRALFLKGGTTCPA